MTKPASGSARRGAFARGTAPRKFTVIALKEFPHITVNVGR
jgi:hypothetical protein